MAIRKLSLSLFSAKAGIAQTEGSTQYLHFLASVKENRDAYAFVCESQPLLTVNSHGLPERCPLCRQDDPISNTKTNHERRREC